MDVEFYFDPSCPWCWVTSRWLLVIQDKRDVQISWRPFSLALKNGELNGTGSTDRTPHGDDHRAAHRVLRVIMAAAESDNDQIIELYTAFGIPFHTAGFTYDDDMINDVLTDKGLNPSLLSAADDTSYDEALQQSIDSATNAAGQDIGVPTIIFTTRSGERTGYFGPILDALPDDDECLTIWDGLSAMADSRHFFELKRTRRKGGPDTASTARC